MKGFMKKEAQSEHVNSEGQNAAEMDSIALRIRVAELCGWTDLKMFSYFNGDRISGLRGVPGNCRGHYRSTVPDYPNDLNACHEFENLLAIPQRCQYVTLLDRMFDDPDCIDWPIVHATAEQRCRAFVATMEGRSVS